MQVLGMMSGTSLDGIDVAALRTDGRDQISSGPRDFFAYSVADRQSLRAALDCAQALSTADLQNAQSWPASLRQAADLVTQRHIEAARGFLAKHNTQPQLIGFHGQSVTHRPREAMTLQIGDAAALAKALGVDVVGDFRSQDMRAGGQGAPLVPLFHAALLGSVEQPIGVVNLGGIANLTWLDGDGNILAFDTGPANALIDDWVLQTTGDRLDANGQLAAQGGVDARALQALMGDDYFRQAAPKSLDRLHFNLGPVAGLSPEDGAATLTAFTAESLAAGLHLCAKPPSRLILCGGGRHNAHLRQCIANACACEVQICEALGWDGDALEAQAFGWLAVRAQAGLALSLPQTTGAREASTGGVVFKAARR
jgi:anhydro-N-acetylmuramic acid kinase